MANVRLKVNMIIGGKNYPRDSVLDDQLIPERLRTEAYVSYDQDGKILLLTRSLRLRVHQSPIQAVLRPVTRSISWRVSFWSWPKFRHPSANPSKKERITNKTNWSFEDQAELRRTANDAYLKQFETEPEIPTRWGSR